MVLHLVIRSLQVFDIKPIDLAVEGEWLPVEVRERDGRVTVTTHVEGIVGGECQWR